MTLAQSAERAELQAVVREFVADQAPIGQVRPVLEEPVDFDAQLWRRMSSELGLAALSLPAESGGAGYGLRELSVVLSELGRGLVPNPLLGSIVLCAGLLLRSNDKDAQAEFLPRLASGALIGSAAISEATDYQTSWIPSRLATVATNTGRAPSLTGRKSLVLNARSADIFVVLADNGGRPGLFVVDKDAAGVNVIPLVTPDTTRPMADVSFDSTPARHITSDAEAALTAVTAAARLALASEQLGAMGACVATTAEYAKIRFAFGNPIGAYQGVKHRLAEHEMNRQIGLALLLDAARCVKEEPLKFPIAAAAAGAFIGEKYTQAAYDMVQLHGGIGYTWEHEAHLYYKNALFGGQLFGGTESYLDDVADLLLSRPLQRSNLGDRIVRRRHARERRLSAMDADRRRWEAQTRSVDRHLSPELACGQLPVDQHHT